MIVGDIKPIMIVPLLLKDEAANAPLNFLPMNEMEITLRENKDWKMQQVWVSFKEQLRRICQERLLLAC